MMLNPDLQPSCEISVYVPRTVSRTALWPCADLGFSEEPVTQLDQTDPDRSDPNGGFLTMKLSEMPAETLMDEFALAGVLDVSPRTIRRMVYRGELPQGIKMGGRRIWMAGTLVEYLKTEAERLASLAKKTASRFRVME